MLDEISRYKYLSTAILKLNIVRLSSAINRQEFQDKGSYRKPIRRMSDENRLISVIFVSEIASAVSVQFQFYSGENDQTKLCNIHFQAESRVFLKFKQ